LPTYILGGWDIGVVITRKVVLYIRLVRAWSVAAHLWTSPQCRCSGSAGIQLIAVVVVCLCFGFCNLAYPVVIRAERLPRDEGGTKRLPTDAIGFDSFGYKWLREAAV